MKILKDHNSALAPLNTYVTIYSNKIVHVLRDYRRDSEIISFAARADFRLIFLRPAERWHVNFFSKSKWLPANSWQYQFYISNNMYRCV